MPAYDFLSGVASAVEKQSNALQAYGLQKREQEREQQERTQYNQVFTELGQFLASGQEIPEERIQTWTSMMGAAPPEIVTAFTNAMNTLGNRREEQQYRTVQTGIAQEGLNLQRQQLRQGASEFDRRLADAVAERTWRSGEAELDRQSQRQIAGMQMSNRQMEETFNRVRMLQAQYAYAENDDTRKAIEQQINEALGINVSNTPQDRGASKTPQEWIQSLGPNTSNASARMQLLQIRNQFQEGSADRKSVNDAILMLTPDVSGRATSTANTPAQGTVPSTNSTTTGTGEGVSGVSDVSYPPNVRSIEDMLSYARSKFEEADRADVISRGTDLSTTRSKHNWKSEVDRLQRLQEFSKTHGWRVRF